jgi:hypothetical protein
MRWLASWWFRLVMVGLVLVGGCGETDSGPRFGGRVVSHVDTYGSGTGSEAQLDEEGTLSSGFEYGDATKPDWTSEINWRFLRQDGDEDVYRIDWTFRMKDGAGASNMKEVSFDGQESVKVFANHWQVVSIEPAAVNDSGD